MLLYCVPHAGASAMNFLKWKPLLSDGITLVPLELAGRGVKHNQSLYTTFSEAVEDLFSDFKKTFTGGSFALFGHSLGGWLVYELYYRIKNSMQLLPDHIFFSGRYPPDIPEEQAPEMLNQDEMLIKIVSEFYDTTTVSLDSTMLAYIKKIIKGDLMLAKDYCYRKRQELIQSPITVLSGTRDPKITNQQLLGWKLFAGNKCTICKVEGNHFFPFNNGQEITSILNCTLMDS